MSQCVHNARHRYTNGFLCEDCNTWFSKDSPTYRSSELLCSLWCALHNINAELSRAGEPIKYDVEFMRDKIGIGIKHDNYEELIVEAEEILARYGRNADSATMELR